MTTTFSDLGLHDALLAALNEAGYTEPTAIQSQGIPIALSGKDLMASAQTGTGKTAAFMLPSLHRLTMTPGGKGKGPRVLVLTPTRELARQVEAAAMSYGKRLRMRTVSILGGMNYQVQQRNLARPIDVMVATPGRLLDLINRGQITLDRVEVLILDEADRMLDLGFIDDVELIAEKAPAERQTLLFSATLEDRIATLAARVMRNPERLQISAQRERHENITQGLYFCDDMDHKKAILLKLLADPEVNQSVVFTATRRDAEQLSIELATYGLQTAALHGDMKQPARNRTLRDLKSGLVRCLVATDVAARGIDVVGISHVFNFDLPMVLEDYVHRIGRTGRAGRTGTAVSLVNRRDRGKLQRLAAYTGQSIPELTIAGMEPRPAPKYRDNGPSGRPGGHRGARPEGARRDGPRTASGYSSSRPPRDDARGDSRRDDTRRDSYRGDAAPRAAAPRDGGFRDAPRAAGPRDSYRDAPRAAAPRRDSFRDAPRAAAAPRVGADGEPNGNVVGAATHERSAFERQLRLDRRPQRSGPGFSADRKQSPARPGHTPGSREGAASKEGFDGRRSDRTPAGPRSWSK